MANENLDLSMVRNIFDVRVREIQRTHLKKRNELLRDLRRRGLMSSGLGYDEIIELLSKQIEQDGQIYLDALFEVVDSSTLHINNDLCAEMTNAVDNILDALHARASGMIQAHLARQHMYGEIQEAILRGLRFKIQDIKDHFKKKIIEFEFHRQNKTPQGATNSQKHSDKSGIKSFPLPEGVQLSEICLSFIADDTIKVKIRNQSIKVNYAEIGFRDGRKGSLWDSRWEVLRDDFAQNNGVVGLDTQNTKWDVKMAVYEINKRLKELFITDKRLFHNYDAKAKIYKTKFKISYNVGGKTDSEEQSKSKDEHSTDVERLLKLPKDEKIKEYQQMYGLSEDQVEELKKKSEQVLNADLKASLNT